MKPHILIVEDEAILYERLRRRLEEEGYSVADYTKSYNQAVVRLREKEPDIALLDIELKGEKSGIDVGKLLNSHYQIPFIYLTNHGDNVTFERSLHSNHEQFIIKTKPRPDMTQVLAAIKTVLYKKDQRSDESFTKTGVIGLTDYLSEHHKMGNETVSKVPVDFEDIALFTVGQYENKKGEIIPIKRNYLAFITIYGEAYLMSKALSEIETKLPNYFAKVSGSAIVNVKSKAFDGRINGVRLKVANQIIKITDKYREEFERKLRKFYEL